MSPRAAALWTLAFAGLTLLRIPFHEMWRDEMNIWVAAVDSSSLADLAHNLSYGGHGLLWPVSVYALVQLVPHTVAMQCLHAAFAAAAAWVVLRFAPFPARLALLIAFGYYLFFEYAVISRHYAPGLLCVVAALALLAAERPRHRPAALCLALAAHTTVYGLILGVAVWAGWLVAWRRERPVGPPGRSERLAVALSSAIVVLSVAIAVVWLRPPEDALFAPWTWDASASRATAVAGTLWRAFVPVPAAGLHFWNSNILDRLPLPAAALGLLIAGAVTWRFRRRPAALVCWAVGAGGILLFSYFKYLGYQRHHGHLFLAFLAAAWLAARERGRDSRPDISRLQASAGPGVWLTLALSIQLAAGLYASAIDLARPFSASREAAAYIRDHGLDDRLIVADPDHFAVPVVGRLERPRIYYPRAQRTERMVIWDSKRRLWFPEPAFLAALEIEMRRASAPVLVLTSYPLGSLPESLHPITSFEPGIVEDEVYYLYRSR